MAEPDNAVHGGGGIAEQEESAVLGGGGITDPDSAVQGGNGMRDPDSAVLGAGGMTDPDSAVLGGGGITGPPEPKSRWDVSQVQLAGELSPDHAVLAPDSILLIVRPAWPFRNRSRAISFRQNLPTGLQVTSLADWVSGMHYTAMAALRVYAAPAWPRAGRAVSPPGVFASAAHGHQQHRVHLGHRDLAGTDRGGDGSGSRPDGADRPAGIPAARAGPPGPPGAGSVRRAGQPASRSQATRHAGGVARLGTVLSP